MSRPSSLLQAIQAALATADIAKAAGLPLSIHIEQHVQDFMKLRIENDPSRPFGFRQERLVCKNALVKAPLFAYAVGMVLKIRRDGVEQVVRISSSSYENEDGMQWVLHDDAKGWDVCRGTSKELDQVLVEIMSTPTKKG